MMRILRPAALLALTLLLAACADDGSPEPVDTIDREVFIETYIALRVAALESQSGTLTPDERAQILDRHGVGEEDLIEFARVHGSDPEWMEGVWTEVKERMDSLGAVRDTAR